ncbi:MAG: HAD family phosphatase [Provencibacterium sp.]|jgi:Cof subfamily protein (haloacid dehalogenase superfamily)|nr:HAD family phosphatase [Provencibacterium sp.]
MRLLKKYLYSDMDHTVIASDKTVSERNQQALRLFTSLGGRFGVATGRNVAIARPYLKYLPVNSPSIVYNGAAVYDFNAGKFLHRLLFPAALGEEIMNLAIATYPQGSAQAFSEGPILLLNPNSVTDHYILEENQPHASASVKEGCAHAFKVQMYGEHERLLEVQAAVEERLHGEGYLCTFSAPYYLEYLPLGASKGGALRWIEENLGQSREETAAVGDFFNDLEMLEMASVGAAVANAPEEVRRRADMVVAGCDHHALEDFILHHLIEE